MMMNRSYEGYDDEEGLYWTLWFIFSFRWLSYVARASWILCNNVYSISSHLAWLLVLSPIRLVHPDLYYKIEEVLFGWLLCQVSCWNHTAGYRIQESGDDLDEILSQEEPVLFMPNHQSTADVPFCMTIFASRHHKADKVMWIMDKVFKYSNFGWVAWMHDDFFILAGKQNRERSLDELKSHLQNVFIPKKRQTLVVFPEGGFLRKRKAVSHEFAKKNGLPLLEHCTLPRTGAIEVILDVLGHQNKSNGCTSKIRKLVDVTIAYPGGVPLDLLSILFGNRPSCITQVHYRIFDINDVPSNPSELRTWMYNLYIEKEKLLDEFYRTGTWSYSLWDKTLKSKPPREIHHDPIYFLLSHAFSLVSFFFFSFCLRSIWTGI